jgi:hypothetical protein
LAFFITWTTYGSWLPGDPRGWVDGHGAVRTPNDRLRRVAARGMREAAVELTWSQRQSAEQAVTEQSCYRGWTLHATSCRTCHMHVVVAAPDRQPDEVLRCLKAWCSRRLSAGMGRSRTWWSKGGSVRWLFDTEAVADVIAYVKECQDRPRV